MRFSSRTTLLFVLNAALILFAFNFIAYGQERISLRGVLSVIYQDHPEMSEILYRLHTPDGQIVPLSISEGVLAQAGGIMNLMGARVNVTLADSTPSLMSPDVVTLYPVSSINVEMTRSESEPSIRNLAGSQTWLNLLCKFSGDTTTPFTSSQVTGLFANSLPMLDHYYRENSYNQVSIPSVTTTNWATLPRTASQYLVSGTTNLTLLFNDCTALHAGSVTFNNYFGINLFFNNSVGNFYYGSSCNFATLQGTQKCWRTTWLPYFGGFDLHVYAHEIGHAYGLPHSNNNDGDTDPYDNPFDIMSGRACFIYSQDYRCQPQHTIAYHKNVLGWITPARIFTLSSIGSFTLNIDRLTKPNSSATQVVIIPIDSTNFYYVEARRKDFSDYDNTLPSSGVIVHHINTTRAEPAWLIDPSGTGYYASRLSVFEPGETYVNPSRGFSVRVNSQTSEGYNITLTKAPNLIVPDLVTTTHSVVLLPGRGFATVRVRNNGNVLAEDVSVVLDPGNSNYYLNNIVTTPECEGFRGYLCTLGDIPPNSEREIVLEIRPYMDGNVSIGAIAVSNGEESNRVNNRANIEFGSINAMPDLELDLTSNVDTVNVNDLVTYEYSLRNWGGANPNQITLNAVIPSQMSIQSWSWEFQGGFAFNPCTKTGNQVNCNFTYLPPPYQPPDYEIIVPEFRVTIVAKALSAGVINVTGSASSNLTDANTVDNSASVATTVGYRMTGSPSFQGRPAAPNALLILPLDVIVTPTAGGAPVFNGSVTTDNMGRFTVNGILPGTYNIRVKGDHTLSIVVSATLTSGSNNVTIGMLKEGDANDDNTVLLTDFSLLANSFGKVTGQAGFDARADFNGDGQVNLTDFSLLASNYGQQGQN